MCLSSLTKRECFRVSCQFSHVKGTKRQSNSTLNFRYHRVNPTSYGNGDSGNKGEFRNRNRSVHQNEPRHSNFRNQNDSNSNQNSNDFLGMRREVSQMQMMLQQMQNQLNLGVAGTTGFAPRWAGLENQPTQIPNQNHPTQYQNHPNQT